MAWRGGDFSKDDISVDLSQRQIAEDVLLRLRKAGLVLGEIDAQHCRHPALDDDLGRVFDEIQEGRGIVIVRGLPADGHSVEDISTMFGALAAHFGRGVSQSALGDLLARSGTRPHRADRRVLAVILAAASCRCTSIWRRSSA